MLVKPLGGRVTVVVTRLLRRIQIRRPRRLDCLREQIKAAGQAPSAHNKPSMAPEQAVLNCALMITA